MNNHERDAGCNEYDNAEQRIKKVSDYEGKLSKNRQDNFNKIISSSTTNNATIGPILFILACAVILTIYLIFDHTKSFVNSNSNSNTPFEKTYTAQSKNFEYQVDQPYRIAAIISNNNTKDDASTTFKGSSDQFIDFYKSNYKNIFTNYDYDIIFRDYCKNNYCKDITLPDLRKMAAKNKKHLEFDQVTTKILSDYWNKVDPNNQYDYQPYYIACTSYVDEISVPCIKLQKTYPENYVVRYLNRKEKIVNPADFQKSTVSR